MKKHKKKYKTPIWRHKVYAVEIPLGSRDLWFVNSGPYKWLMQHRYKCDWRRPYKGTGIGVKMKQEGDSI